MSSDNDEVRFDLRGWGYVQLRDGSFVDASDEFERYLFAVRVWGADRCYWREWPKFWDQELGAWLFASEAPTQEVWSRLKAYVRANTHANIPPAQAAEDLSSASSPNKRPIGSTAGQLERTSITQREHTSFTQPEHTSTGHQECALAAEHARIAATLGLFVTTFDEEDSTVENMVGKYSNLARVEIRAELHALRAQACHHAISIAFADRSLVLELLLDEFYRIATEAMGAERAKLLHQRSSEYAAAISIGSSNDGLFAVTPGAETLRFCGEPAHDVGLLFAFNCGATSNPVAALNGAGIFVSTLQAARAACAPPLHTSMAESQAPPIQSSLGSLHTGSSASGTPNIDEAALQRVLNDMTIGLGHAAREGRTEAERLAGSDAWKIGRVARKGLGIICGLNGIYLLLWGAIRGNELNEIEIAWWVMPLGIVLLVVAVTLYDTVD